jgi:NADPH-dependent 7-cyano-7-deazaguanine reductase QueF-like protein
MIGAYVDIYDRIMLESYPRITLRNVINVSAQNLEFLTNGYHNKV